MSLVLVLCDLVWLGFFFFFLKMHVSSCLYFCPTDTVPEERAFKLLIGPFGSDVAVMNISLPYEVLSVEDCNVRGFNVLEHKSPNSNSKAFTVEVPFTDHAVLQTVSFTQLGKLNIVVFV